MAPADDPDDKIAALEEEIDQLRHALVSHAAVDQAIGVLMASAGLRSQEGWEVLETASQHTNTKLREIAQHVLRWAEDGELPNAIRSALHEAVVTTRRRRLRTGSGPGQDMSARRGCRQTPPGKRASGTSRPGDPAQACD
jgi:hypothetical protein